MLSPGSTAFHIRASRALPPEPPVGSHRAACTCRVWCSATHPKPAVWNGWVAPRMTSGGACPSLERFSFLRPNGVYYANLFLTSGPIRWGEGQPDTLQGGVRVRVTAAGRGNGEPLRQGIPHAATPIDPVLICSPFSRGNPLSSPKELFLQQCCVANEPKLPVPPGGRGSGTARASRSRGETGRPVAATTRRPGWQQQRRPLEQRVWERMVKAGKGRKNKANIADLSGDALFIIYFDVPSLANRPP